MADRPNRCTGLKDGRMMDPKEEIRFRQMLSYHMQVGPSMEQRFAIAFFMALTDLRKQRDNGFDVEMGSELDSVLTEEQKKALKKAGTMFFEGPDRRFYEAFVRGLST